MVVHLRAAYVPCGEDLENGVGDLSRVSLNGGRGEGWTLMSEGWIFLSLFCTWAALLVLSLAICTPAAVELASRDEVTGVAEIFSKDWLDEGSRHGAESVEPVERPVVESEYLFFVGGSSRSWKLPNWRCCG